ncbi:HEAT repeat domain-containing protein [Candidatus Lokiarchaeum ossiferum]|uniref:HEAT repeat domain-containing protein n=1 Tax=Candidatus Lokiarchaeum ossiferum TaxID=2951803 RepID=UPI00352D0900
MALPDILIQLTYVIIGVIVFFMGFLLVYKNLKKINTVEGEKFNGSDWLAMIGFGLLFGLAMIFIVNITFELILPVEIPSIAGYVLMIMLGVLVIYPLWEVIFLGRPTSDSVHDFHKFLESKILDRFKGKVAYLVSLLIFIIIYLVPIIIINLISNEPWQQIAFIWFLLFPLFFLAYFAANGTVSGIIAKTYTNTIPARVMTKGKLGNKKVIGIIMVAVTWIPFMLNIYNFGNPILKAIRGVGEIPTESSTSSQLDKYNAYISLFTTTVFGIKGFFSKFWNKKSKTKTIDFLFSGYLMIGIGVNMLLSFVQIDPSVVASIFDSIPIPFIASLGDVFYNYTLLLPIIIISSGITFVYGIINLVQVNSDFHSDIRLQSTTKAFGKIDLDKMVESRNEMLEDLEKGKQDKKKKEKKKKYDYATLYKSLLLAPSYSKYGVDLNEQVRQKAAQYLFLMSVDDREIAQKIIEFIFAVTIEKDTIEKDITEIQEQYYLSKEAFDSLGEIGEIYPDLVMERLINALEIVDNYTQRYILDALGDIGETKENMKVILSKILPLFSSKRYDVRLAAFQAMSEMILEGDSSDKEFVKLALDAVYTVLKDDTNEGAIDTCLEALVKMSARIADDIDIEKIIPFLTYSKGKDQDTTDFIIQNAIIILSYMVYYNMDQFTAILNDLKPFLKDQRDFIRYAAVDALGNYILKCPEDKIDDILVELLILSTNDANDDVAHIATESIAEFLIMHKGYKITIDNQTISILDYYMNALVSSNVQVTENASEALKQISPLYDEDIYPQLEKHLKSQENLELVRDCLHVIAVSGVEEHLSTDLELIYSLTEHEDPSVRSEAILTLGFLGKNRPEIKPEVIVKRLDDKDPQVRRESIFALGKIGKQNPTAVVPVLIQKFFELDRHDEDKVSEVELYAETLGEIGKVHPSNEIIITLQNVLMGDTNPFSKDVIARALGTIGYGMIQSGKAIKRIENDAFYNQISWLRSADKAEYTIGNLIIIFLEALQLKGIPDSVMNEISDSIQDLLPVFLFAQKDEKKPKNEDVILETIKSLLAQAYYANYNNEILETIDRVDSLLSFKRFFKTEDEILQKQFIFYATQYTADGKQFHDQGEVFLLLKDQDPEYLKYALKSFEISQQLSPYEFYTPNAVLQMGIIHKTLNNRELAKQKFEEALEIFTSLDEVDKMRECDANLKELS